MSKKTRIVSIGAAVQDVFLQGEIFRPHRENGKLVQEFLLGNKNDIESVVYSTGGGATNAAVTFARQGLKSAFMGHIGRDIAGRAVIEELHREGVGTVLAQQSDKHGTAYSTLLLAPNGERTILTYRGASEHFDLHVRDFQNVQTDWFYISSLAGNFEALKVIMKYAHKHDIKVAINPGKGELKHSREFKEFLPYVSVLSVNKEEAQQLFHGDAIEELVRKAAQHVPYVIITDGPKGSVAADRNHIYKAGMYKDVPVIDRTGAGDAFSSGFTAMVAGGHNMELAVTFASANSTSVVNQIGAKAGILRQDVRLHRMPMVITPF